VIAAALILAFTVVDRTVPRVTPHKVATVAVGKLPRTIGTWTNDQDEPTDPTVAKYLPSATMLTRVYRDQSGHVVELTLETSPKASDYHPPTYCMSAQGWSQLASRQQPVGALTATELELQDHSGRQCMLLYWYVVDKDQPGWTTFGARLMSGQSPTRLFVRIVAFGDPDLTQARDVARSFARDVQPALTELQQDSGSQPHA